MAQLIKQSSNILSLGNNVFSFDNIRGNSGSTDTITDSEFSPYLSGRCTDTIHADSPMNRLFLSSSNKNKVLVYSLLNKTYIQSISLSRPIAIFASQTLGKIFICEESANRVAVLDYTTLAPITTFATPAPSGVSGYGGNIVVSSFNSSYIKTFNATTYALVNSISSPGSANVSGDYAGGRIFSCERETKRFVIYDGDLNEVDSSHKVGAIGGTVFVTSDFIYFAYYLGSYKLYKTPYVSPIVGGTVSSQLEIWCGFSPDYTRGVQYRATYKPSGVFYLDNFIL